MCGQRRLGGVDRVWPEDRELFVDDPQLRIRRLGLGHDRRNASAIGAVVVEELDEGDIAVRVSVHGARRVTEHLVGARTHGCLGLACCRGPLACRSEEHTSELQSLMRISYAVFCLKKKK